MTTVLGVDFGTRGAAVLIVGSTPYDLRFSKTDAMDRHAWLKAIPRPCLVYVENIHGRRGDFVNKVAQMMRWRGRIEEALEIVGLDQQISVEPQVWQREFGLLGIKDYNERKRKAKRVAQELFPLTKIVEEIADAILIAEYGRRESKGELTNGIKKNSDNLRPGTGIIRTASNCDEWY